MRKQILLALLVAATAALAGCATPWAREAKAETPLLLPQPGCAKVDIQAAPNPLHQGQMLVVRANVTNVCESAFQVQSRSGCEQNGLDLVVAKDGQYWRVRGPDAAMQRACPAGRGPVVTLQPGESVNATWMWDGTFSDVGCVTYNGHGCGAGYPAPRGEYQLRVELMGKLVGTSAVTLQA